MCYIIGMFKRSTEVYKNNLIVLSVSGRVSITTFSNPTNYDYAIVIIQHNYAIIRYTIWDQSTLFVL